MRKSEPVEEVDEEIQKLMDTMLETMYFAGGMGLAAPQLGIHKRVIIIGIDDDLLCLANPEIVERSDPDLWPEGCLSFPGVQVNVKRDSVISVRGLDRQNKNVVLNYTNLMAIAVQHEIDHLDGITLAQRAGTIERERIRKQMKKYHRIMKKASSKRR